jgi:cell division protein FtsZ
MSVEELTEKKESSGLRVSILGVGGAGNNLLSHAISGGVSPRQCVAVNTDRNQLSTSRAKNKVLLTETSDLARWNARDDLANVRMLANRVSPFTRESDFTILLTGLGGVTGTMAGPAIAQINRGQARPVISIVALPFIHERDRRFLALRGLKRMVASSDCTVVVDNAVELKKTSTSERGADEIASLAVRSLSEVVAMGSSAVSQRILSVMRLGQVATVCVAPVSSSERIQPAIIEALQTPSARLPLSKARGAVLLYHGLEPLSGGQALHAYEAVSSLVGHDVEFVQLSTRSTMVPGVSVFLTGYSYSMAIRTFVDLIEDLYDMEYGERSETGEIGLPVRLYQMEGQ